MIKKSVILGSVLLASAAFWFAAKAWMDNPVSALENYAQWAWPLGLLVVCIGVRSLALLLLDTLRFRLWSIAAAGLPVVVFFGFHWVYAAALGVMLCLDFYAMRRINDEYQSRMRINLRGILGSGAALLITSTFLFLSAAYYLSPTVQASTTAQKLPPTITQLVQEIVRRFLSEELTQLAPQSRVQAENQVLRQVMDQLNTLAMPYLKYLPFILTFGLFLLLQGLSFLFSWLAIALATLIFTLLKTTRFVKIEEYDMRAERIFIQ